MLFFINRSRPDSTLPHPAPARARWRGFAANAAQHGAEEALAPGFRCHPFANLPGWVVPNVLPVAAVKIGHPVALVITMKSDDPAIHVGSQIGRASCRARG